MRKAEDNISLTLVDGSTLNLYPISKYAKLYLIDEAEAEEFGEASVQILESHRYEYEFSNSDFQIIDTLGCTASPSKTTSRGILAPGNYVGTLELNISDGKEEFKYYIEVLATKFDANNDYDKSYRKNYRSMVEDITEKCTELLMQSNSPVNQYFEPNFNKENETIYQKFSFVKSVLQNDEFEESLMRIFSSPKTNWINKEEDVDVRSIKKFSNKNIQELLRGTNRIPLPKNHYLRKNTKLKDLPTKINNYKQEASLDNPENRFIQHALQVYLQFCESCSAVFKPESKDQKEANFLANKLEGFLNHSFFKEISKPTTLKLNSPTLQRKSGYRQILKSWLMFDLASKLTWTGGKDVYSAGKRDIATLYEYWLFFVLYDLMKTKFNLDKLSHNDKAYNHLFEKEKQGINLIIKSGSHTALEGSSTIKNRALNIKFSFNRTFSGNKDKYPKAGSWTTAMRPDYTLSVWPKELKETEAETKEQIVHIHFDAKYKVRNFIVKSNDDETKFSDEEINADLAEIKKQERAGIYKNADLLKMHAYKDAIRRTGGAYILYPGKIEKRFKGFHELIPGLGAFSVNPDNEAKDVAALSDFINEVINELVNRTSQRENIATKTYEITKNGKSDSLNEAIPEYLNGKKLIPDETFVLIGYYKSQKHLDWILKQNLYNFRTGLGLGSKRIKVEDVNAKYIVLHGKNELQTSKIYRLSSEGIKVFSRDNLVKAKYPSSPTNEAYLMYKIEEDASSQFKNISWNLRKLENFESRRQSAKPYTVSLSELMRVAFQ